MNHGRRGRIILACGLVCLVLVCSGCPSVPPVIVDTTGVDTVIVDLADTAGDIETQTVTVYQTVKEYIKDPAELAKVQAEFDKLNASITRLKAIPPELARVHAVEIGKLAKEIARLQPFEVEAEKEKAAKWQAYAIIALLASTIAAAVFLKVRGII